MEAIIKSEKIDTGIVSMIRISGIDKGLLLRVVGCNKKTSQIGNMVFSEGFSVSVIVEKSPNRDYKKGDTWDFTIPCHFKTVEDYFNNKYSLVKQ